MNCEKIGKFIAELRKENNMTQKELADKLNITDSAVSKWERGCGCPDISLVVELSEILGISINELLAGERIEQLTKEKVDQIMKDSIIDYTKFEKTRLLRKTGIISLITLIETLILFCTFYPVANVFVYLSNRLTNSYLAYPYFYQNVYTLLAVIGMFILIGIALFIFFKFIEVKLISKHKKDSYQYLLFPCSLIIIWEIVYSFSNLSGMQEPVYILLWSPIAFVIIGLNLIYEFIIRKN